MFGLFQDGGSLDVKTISCSFSNIYTQKLIHTKCHESRSTRVCLRRFHVFELIPHASSVEFELVFHAKASEGQFHANVRDFEIVCEGQLLKAIQQT